MQDLTAPRPPRTAAYGAVLLAAALLVVGLVFQQLVTFLLAIFITIIIAIPLSAAATWLERRHVPRWLGVLITLLGGLLVVAGVLALVIPPFVQQITTFVDDVPQIITDLRSRFQEATGAKPSKTGTDVQSYLQGFVDQPGKLVGPLTSIGLGVAGALGSLVLVLITAYYVALNPDPLVEGGLRLFPPARREWARQVGERLRESYIGWLRGVVVDMAVTFVLLFIGLSLIGLKFALVFAVLSALLVVIPYFGSIAGAIPPVLFGLADSPTKGILALVVYVLVQQIESNVIIPVVMSRTVKLHPAVIAIGVVIVGKLFGFVGLFVAVPILTTFTILVEEVWIRALEERDEEHVPEGLELATTAQAAAAAGEQRPRAVIPG
jgi:predicted PurR-regulated permease PerM